MKLIDANEIDFRCSYERMCMADKEKCKKCEYYVCSFEDIQDQPTAYDPDRIVEQLEELNEEEERFVNNHVFIQGIIEIVKGGAENDS